MESTLAPANFPFESAAAAPPFKSPDMLTVMPLTQFNVLRSLRHQLIFHCRKALEINIREV